ncbi:MAG: peptidase S8 [Anaerolineaceae bacterium]|nr:peptidase S8 [Anaerolineaceae bacterium]MCB9101257.1 peptidase S8 [Anaerolineales bacterium]
MIQKLTISFFLILLLSLIWFVTGLINVKAAPSHTIKDNYAMVLAPRIETLTPANRLTEPVLIGQTGVTATSSSKLYFPAIVNNFCSTVFNYNEPIRYNLSKINAETAWNSCSQGEGIIVAVVDTGIDLDHPDLQANLVSGQSFVSGTSSPDDDAGHGTHVAGMVAGVSNNGGIIGVAPKASLMPVKVLDSQGSGSLYDVADGIEWATDNGANVINLSLGSVGNSSTLQAAVDYATNQGALLVAAGGNCGDAYYYLNGCSYRDQPVYPAAYTNVMAVASTDSSDNQSSFSNEGSYIEIAAPGSSIYSTYPSGAYATMSGTSMASPHVAGLAALIWSQNPDWTNQEVRSQIRATAQDLGSSGWDSQFGYGRIDASAALNSQTTTASTVNPGTEATDAAAVDAPYVPGEILLKLRSDVTVNHVLDPARLAQNKVKVAGTIDQLGVMKLTVTAGQEQELLAELLNSGGVIYAELNYIVTVH